MTATSGERRSVDVRPERLNSGTTADTPHLSTPTRPVVVGVAGGSGSGKSTVVRRIRSALGPERVSVIAHDRYYRDLSYEPFATRIGRNFDHPDSLETELLVEHVESLLAGDPVRVPTYDFAAHVRSVGTTVVEATPIVVVDGILVLSDSRLRALFDYAVYVQASPEERLARRIRRDVAERGRTHAAVVDQFRRTVEPMHERFVSPSRRHADLVIRGGGFNDRAVEALIAMLVELAELPEAPAPVGDAASTAPA